MKVYKTSEAIAMLEVNTNLQFKSMAMNGFLKTLLYDKEKGIKCVQLGKDTHLDLGCTTERISIYTTDKWMLVQKSIPGIEAVKAFEEGKIIKCEIDNSEFVYKKKTDKKLEPMTGTNGYGISAREILHGTWYVEVEQ